MAKHLSMANLVIAMVAIAAMLHGSAAQTTHVVGDATGWTIPSGDTARYSNWARQKTFAVGDILVFRFATGAHDVTEVSKGGYDGCSSTSPISQSTNGPTNITLTAGQHYYICSFPGHCAIGQKLAINVASTAPAPRSSAAATPRPTPVPSRAPVPSPSGAATAPAPSLSTPTGATPPASTSTPPTITSPPAGSTVPSAESPTTTSPPPNTAAPSLAAAALPVTLLSAAFAVFLY